MIFQDNLLFVELTPIFEKLNVKREILNPETTMIVRKIKGETISPEDLTGEEIITCYVGIENKRSIGALTVSYSDDRENKILDKIEISTPGIVRPDRKGVYQFLNGNYLSKRSIDKLTSRILTSFYSKMEGLDMEIASIIVYSDAFVNLDNPQDTSELTNEILDSCRKSIPRIKNKGHIPIPQITANQNKSIFAAKGVINLLSNTFKELPELYLDISSFTSGIVLDRKEPKDIKGIITGLGNHVFDVLSQNIAKKSDSKNTDSLAKKTKDREMYNTAVSDLTDRLMDLMEIRRVSTGVTRVGKVPINVEKSHESKIKLIGCDVGNNGSRLKEISNIGQKFASYGKSTLERASKETLSRLIGEIIKVAYEEELIEDGSMVYLSGKRMTNSISGSILEKLNNLGFKKISEKLIFVENPEIFVGPL